METYLLGKGLKVNFKSITADNLYRPNSVLMSESYNFVHVKNASINKFAPILLKEWFFLLKPGGYLILEYYPTKEIQSSNLESTYWWLFRDNYNIVSHEKNATTHKFIIEKKYTCFVPGDSISKWTFGIVTNGDREDWLDEIIKSIHALKIPQYEIIICGKSRKRKDIIHILFNQRAEKGWITKKKNLICEYAKYENICVLHDRLVLDNFWYKGMQKYGNSFELLGCVQTDRGTGESAGDWLTLGGPRNTMYKISKLRYADWDYNVYLSGQLTIIKKSIWKKVLWDETKYWNDAEDADISFRARDLGFLIRFNPFANSKAITWRHGKIPLKYNFREGLLPKDMYFRRVMRIFGRSINRIPFARRLLSSAYTLFSKTPFYRMLLYGQ